MILGQDQFQWASCVKNWGVFLDKKLTFTAWSLWCLLTVSKFCLSGRKFEPSSSKSMKAKSKSKQKVMSKLQ